MGFGDGNGDEMVFKPLKQHYQLMPISIENDEYAHQHKVEFDTINRFLKMYHIIYEAGNIIEMIPSNGSSGCETDFWSQTLGKGMCLLITMV